MSLTKNKRSFVCNKKFLLHINHRGDLYIVSKIMYAFYIMNYLNVMQKHYTITHCILFFSKTASKDYMHEFPNKQRSLLLTAAKYRKWRKQEEEKHLSRGDWHRGYEWEESFAQGQKQIKFYTFEMTICEVMVFFCIPKICLKTIQFGKWWTSSIISARQRVKVLSEVNKNILTCL